MQGHVDTYILLALQAVRASAFGDEKNRNKKENLSQENTLLCSTPPELTELGGSSKNARGCQISIVLTETSASTSMSGWE